MLRLLAAVIAAASVVAVIFLVPRNQQVRPAVISGKAMGTHYHVKLADTDPPLDRIRHDIGALMEEIEDEASQWRESSWISDFNAANSLDPEPVPGHIWAMLVNAKEVHEKSGGLMDVTVGPLVELWGFGHRPNKKSPTDDEVAKTLGRCGFDKLVLDHRAQTVRRTVPGVQIDLSALAKGYAVDLIDARLRDGGMNDYLIEFGGELLARGAKSGSAEAIEGWTIRLPGHDGRTQAITADSIAYATSGGSEQNRKVDGATVTHLLDPRTGKPMTDAIGAVTVTADRCITADAWATALSVATKKEARRLAKKANIGLMDWRD